MKRVSEVGLSFGGDSARKQNKTKREIGRDCWAQKEPRSVLMKGPVASGRM